VPDHRLGGAPLKAVGGR